MYDGKILITTSEGDGFDYRNVLRSSERENGILKQNLVIATHLWYLGSEPSIRNVISYRTEIKAMKANADRDL